MATLNPTQKLHVDRVRLVRTALRDAKLYAQARAKAIVLDEIAGYQAAVDHEVRLAFDAGVSKLQLRRDGLGTTDSKTLEDILKRSEGAALALAGKLETDPLAHRYSFDIDTEILTVTLDGQTLQDARTNARNEAGEPSAEFTVSARPDGSRYLNNITQFATAPTWDQHPVVSWIRDGSEHQAEALAWWRGKVAATA